MLSLQTFISGVGLCVLAQMHFKVDINLHSYYIILEYSCNRLIAQNLFALVQYVAFWW